jgi:hypothetical protein
MLSLPSQSVIHLHIDSNRLAIDRLHAASHLNLPTPPVPYRKLQACARQNAKSGINFSYAWSGLISSASSKSPHVDAQIEQLRGLVDRGSVSTKLLNSSIAAVVVATDYLVFLANADSSSSSSSSVKKKALDHLQAYASR